MRKLGLLASLAFSAALLSQPALADKRVALVIGNSAYQNVIKLSNPVNDANAMTDTLKAAKFDIVEARRDLKATEMRRALRDFADKARDADVAVVYFAGHGIEVDGTNYLIPTDALLERDTDVYDEAFSLERVLVSVEPAKKLRLVILDACRDNPFTKTMKRTVASRAITRGLAKVEPASPNTLIAYSAKAGSTALDGDSKNSPFTTALVRHIATPGLDLRKAFGFVRDDVLKETGNRQEPYVYGSLGGNDVPLVPVAASALAQNAQSDTRRDYELAMQVRTGDSWDAFLAQHPNGFYANLAKAQLAKIAAENAHVAAAEKARLAAEEKARLAADGAKTAEQAKAAADVKAAEEARIAAEKRKLAEQDRAAAAERSRAAAEAKADAAKSGASTPSGPQLAAVSPSEPPRTTPSTDLPRQLQVELQRVGCLQGSIDDKWTTSSGKALERFNRYATTKFDSKAASAEALDAIKAKSVRVCPLACAHGSRADGDKCTKIVCRRGTVLNDDNECERKRSRTEASRSVAPRRERLEEIDRPQVQARAPRAARPSGQIVCDNGGCRPVRSGCRLEMKDMRIGLTNVEVCN